MLRAVSLFIVLFAVWLLLSGHYTPMLIGLGVISCAAAVLIARRMDIVDREGHPVHLGLRAPLYWAWLGWEIVKSNIFVMGRILSPALTISPTVVRVTTHQQSDLGVVTYANSITLTPGTVSMRVEKDEIEVHALTAELAEDLAGGSMDLKVVRVEGSGVGSGGGTEATDKSNGTSN